MRNFATYFNDWHLENFHSNWPQGLADDNKNKFTLVQVMAWCHRKRSYPLPGPMLTRFYVASQQHHRDFLIIRHQNMNVITLAKFSSQAALEVAGNFRQRGISVSVNADNKSRCNFSSQIWPYTKTKPKTKWIRWSSSHTLKFWWICPYNNFLNDDETASVYVSVWQRIGAKPS